jgi:transposase InsO family protein
MKAVAVERRRFGYRRIHIMLDQQGIGMNLKKLRRLYGEERLQVRKRGGRKRALGTRRPMAVRQAANERWSLDFISDALTDGRRFRVLAVVDDFTRECLALVADTSLSGTRVVRELDAVIARRGHPGTIVSDNVLAREQIAVLGVRSHGIRATGYLRNSYPGGLRRQEVVSSIANTGSAWLPPSPSLRRDPKSQAEGPNIIYEVASCASTAL